METKIFILKKKSTFRRNMRLFLKDVNGKMTSRTVVFTTEHLVHSKQRKDTAKTKHAEYHTSNKYEIEALMADTSYGITFILKGDIEGKLKKDPFVKTPTDAARIALSNLFADAGMKFDPTKPVAVLKEEYSIHMNVARGVNIRASKAMEIPLNPVDVAGEIETAKRVSREAYAKKYGAPIPEIVTDDVAFLDAMNDPKFDAPAYIKSKIAAQEAEDKAQEEEENKTSEGEGEATINELRQQYFEKEGKNVANVKKNDAAWIKAQLAK